jgi:carbonyl reductase 1
MAQQEMDGRVALVTGGNRGLGLGTVSELARRGLQVLLASRGADGAAEAARLVGQGLKVEHEPLDVSDAGSIAALAERLRARGLALDVLVNNAGISLHGFDAQVARRTLDTNFFGALHVTDALLPQLRSGGHIVMVSSGLGTLDGYSESLRARLLDPALTRETLVSLMRAFVEDVAAGRHTREGWPSSGYGASKAGLNALTRVLARELAPRGIHVNAVCPGWVRTDMGGKGAPRALQQGVASIVWPIFAPAPPSGGFFRDGSAIDW